jgi:hypothetical protein
VPPIWNPDVLGELAFKANEGATFDRFLGVASKRKLVEA